MFHYLTNMFELITTDVSLANFKVRIVDNYGIFSGDKNLAIINFTTLGQISEFSKQEFLKEADIYIKS